MTEIERFLEKVEFSKDKFNGSYCLLWKAGISKSGYAYLSINGKMTLAHRWIYKRWIGEIDSNLELDHLCRNRNCVNPNHLEQVTHFENMLRGNTDVAKRYCPECSENHVFKKKNTYMTKNNKRVCLNCKNLEEKRNNYVK